MMPYKPPTNGIYPFYPKYVTVDLASRTSQYRIFSIQQSILSFSSCYTKNFTTQFFCYSPKFHDATVDTFITGLLINILQIVLMK